MSKSYNDAIYEDVSYLNCSNFDKKEKKISKKMDNKKYTAYKHQVLSQSKYNDKKL